MKKLLLLLFLVLTVATVGFLLSSNRKASMPSSEKLPDIVDYNLHIRPILSDRCFKCHGPDASKREAQLRLDIADSAFAALKETPGAHAIVPGNPLSSYVYLNISSGDTSEMMPPPSSGLKLTGFEIKLIDKWIKQGA